MSMKSKRERDRERMRRRILDAAKHLFVKEGVDTVSMRRIAAAIEYSPAAIYRYFSNKREILSTLRDEGFRRLVAWQRQRLTDYPDPVERLHVGCVGYIRFALAEPDSYQLMFCTDCTEVDLEGALASSSMESYGLFRATVDGAVAQGYFGEAESSAAAFAVWGGVHGLAQLIHSGRLGAIAGVKEMDPFVERAVAFLLRPGAAANTDDTMMKMGAL
jgi:AcrR family transcriptional regulator